MSEDLFEKIVDREIPADIVWENDELLAFRDINPQAPVHILVIPKRKIRTLNDLSEGDSGMVGRMVLAATGIAKSEGLADDGYRLVFNCNEGAGQSVWHIHLHLLGGRRMGWPPG
ncbi:MAG: histidine triad nucleotide-binding protein [Wenzhouxiangellaceae bacterium]|nr:histidine triad nucleotide-binding protein [Wenzhouxiangellaceae bacterium]